jgi:hypothetical protein
MNLAERTLKLLLRAAGAVCLLAVVAVVMPRRWMAVSHQWLGLGTLPEGPIVEYLARSLSALYALLGGLMILVAGDVRRYAPVIAYVGATHILMGDVVLAVGLLAALPWYWTACEGPAGAGFGVLVLLLLPAARKAA